MSTTDVPLTVPSGWTKGEALIVEKGFVYKEAVIMLSTAEIDYTNATAYMWFHTWKEAATYLEWWYEL